MHPSIPSIQSSSSFLQNIKTIEDIPVYLKNVSNSQYVVVALHEHLGLVQNFINTIQQLIDNATIIVPDLFCYLNEAKGEEENQNQEEFQPIQKLKFQDLKNIVLKCFNYAKNVCRSVILIGFSVGSAFGLRLVQYCEGLSLGIFFYGYPKIQNFKNDKLPCQTILFHAKNDQIKYLSDKEQLEKLKIFFKNQKLLQITEINEGHGFMNTQFSSFNQSVFRYCKGMVNEAIMKKVKEDIQNDKKKDDSFCQIF